MKKRQIKKNASKLTDDEEIFLKLYRECESVDFYRHNDDLCNATNFVKNVGIPEYKQSGEACWLSARKGKVQAASFMVNSNE